jgi:hypothetical protein
VRYAKLTGAIVEEARRRRRAGALITVMAAEYGVQVNTLSQAVTGVTWPGLAVPPVPAIRASRLTARDVADARMRRRAGASVARMAREFGVEVTTMAKAIDGRTWQHVAVAPVPAGTIRFREADRNRAEANLIAGEKQCPNCKQTLCLEAFSRSAESLDGRNWWCRRCMHDTKAGPRPVPRPRAQPQMPPGHWEDAVMMPLPDMEAARCYGLDWRLFFDAERVDEAKQVCAYCPLRGPCADWATEHGEFGVWGMTTRDQRLRAKREAKRAAA